MQVQRIQNNNTNFKARVNISGASFGDEVIEKLSQKAKRIGLENDVVEFRYYDFTHLTEDYFGRFDATLAEDNSKPFTENFRAIYFPYGKSNGIELLKDKLLAPMRKDLWIQEEQAASNYLDYLTYKYGK